RAPEVFLASGSPPQGRSVRMMRPPTLVVVPGPVFAPGSFFPKRPAAGAPVGAALTADDSDGAGAAVSAGVTVGTVLGAADGGAGGVAVCVTVGVTGAAGGSGAWAAFVGAAGVP